MVRGGAAERAGLERGDEITEINGEKMADFGALTDRIALFQPGDTAELTLLRRGKTMKKRVTFDRWSIKNSRVGPARRTGGLPANQFVPQPRIPSIDRR